MKLNYRSVWISDVHPGARGCKDEYLLDFLNRVDGNRPYLVGDIVDFWKLKSGFCWSHLHNQIVRKVMAMMAMSTEVIYIPGNHDELFRGYIGTVFNGIQLQDRAIHTTPSGERFLVLHGAAFDGVVCSSRWLAVLGSEANDFLVAVNRWFNIGRRLFGFPHWSTSAYIKHKVKNAVNFIFDCERALLHAAEEQGLDGVISGHIHHAAIHANERGIRYCNTGDWVERCTALAESADGSLSIIRWVEDSARLLEDPILETCPDHGRLATAN
jgi:UDP-2,3-diacylglucosamine pyrophosphatase LpxH